MERILKIRAWHGGTMTYFVFPDDYAGYGSAIWMQFTGLTDKNGKEIYEGDIVQVRTFLGEIQGTYTVEYKLNGFNYYAPGKPEQALYFAQNLVEVVGNKFENPELLKDHQ